MNVFCLIFKIEACIYKVYIELKKIKNRKLKKYVES